MNKLVFVLIAVVFWSCQKAQRDEDTSLNTCQDLSLAQTIFSDAYKQVRIAALNSQGISDAETTLTTVYGCEEISVDTTSNPRTMIVDYKYIGCEGLGVDRYGRLLADFYGPFGVEGSAVDIVFSNYFYQDYEINGKIRIVFKERSAEDFEVHSYYLQSASVNDGNSVMTWTSSETWTIQPGSKKGEMFSIKGNSNGTNRKGNTFRSEIISENEMSDDCLFVQKGTVRVDVKNLSVRTLNYGVGACDKAAEVSINGAIYQMSIP